jgi:hypothetical protein
MARLQQDVAETFVLEFRLPVPQVLVPQRLANRPTCLFQDQLLGIQLLVRPPSK